MRATGVDGQSRDVAAFWFLVTFAVVMYSAPAEWIEFAKPLRPALVTSAIALVLMLAGKVIRREGVSLDGVRGIAFAAFSVVAAASIRWSIDPEASTFLAGELAKSIAIYFTMVNLVTTPRRLAVLCAALVLSSIVTSVGVLRWYATGQDLVQGFRARWVGQYGDPNRMAMSVGIVVPLAAAFFMRRQSSWFMRLSCLLAAGLAVWAMVLSHSRGGFVGLAAALATWTLLERRVAQTVVVAILGISLFALAPRSFWDRTGTVTQFEQDESAMGRVHAWTVTSRISTDRPMLGVGGGTFFQAWPLYAPAEARLPHAAHNFFLQVIAELGILGMLLFLVFVGSGTAAAFEASRDEEIGYLGRALSASLVGYLVCSLFAGFLGSPHFYVLLGLAACAQRIAAARQEERGAMKTAPAGETAG
ncbi:MAG: O-antigen ligase family protein [Myxococcaceae bacterium]